MHQPAARAISAAALTQGTLATLGCSVPFAAGMALVSGAAAAGGSKQALTVSAIAGTLCWLGQGELAAGVAAVAWATGTTADQRALAQAGFAGSALSVLLTWALPAAWTPLAAGALAQLWPIAAAVDPQVPLCPRGLPAPLRKRLAAALVDADQAWTQTDDRPGRRLLADAGAELVALSLADARLSLFRPTTPALAGELSRVRERWQATADLLSRARRTRELAHALPATIPETASADLARECDALERHVHATCTSRQEVDRVHVATGSSVTPSPSRARNTRGER